MNFDLAYDVEADLCHGNHVLGSSDGYLYCNRHFLVKSVEPHIHSFYEFIYITEGTCVYNIDGVEFVTSPGDLIFTCPSNIHAFTFPKKCEFTRQFLRVYPDYIKDFPEVSARLHYHSANHKNHIPAYLVEQYGLDQYFSDLNSYNNIEQPETFMIALSCVTGLLAKVNHILQNTDTEDVKLFENKHINKILEYITSHFAQSITLDDIAAEVHMSAVYISKLFKEETGMTLKSYINMYRVVHAKNLILGGEKISSLYEKCGFENYSTFYRAFVKCVGMSPECFKNSIYNTWK